MPNINLRLTEEEHEELRAWAHGSRRSIQREIVFRLFDGALSEGGGRDVSRSRPAGTQEPTPSSLSASVQPTAHDVPVRPHFRKDRPAVQCESRGLPCSVCGAD